MSNKKSSYKLLSIDLDGTLLSPILRRAKKADCIAIQEFMSAGGIPFINTGRAPWAVEKTLKRINEAGPNKVKLVSFWNGAYIRDLSDGEEWKRQISHPYCKKIYEIVKRNKGMIWFHTPKGLESHTIYVDPLNFFIKLGYHLAHLQKVKSDADLASYKIDILSTNKTIVAKIYHELIKSNLDKTVTISHSSPRLIEITPLNTNKGSAIRYYSKKYNIPKNEIVSMGDSFNDLSAFKASALSIGINPRNPNLLEHCGAIVNHKSKGVREAISTYILNDVDKQNYQLIFADLDGTLIDGRTKLFSNETKLALQQCTNHLIPIAIASGRGIYDGTNIVNSMELNPKTNIYIIGNNGATIFDIYTKTYISQSPIDQEVAKQVFAALKVFAKENNGNLGFIIHPHSQGLLFYNEKFWKPLNFKKTGFEDQYDPWIESQPTYVDEYPQDIICYKFVVKFPNPESAKKGYKQLKERFKDLEVCLSSDVNLEINKKGINKGFAAKKLVDKIGISFDHTLAMGDGQNDIEVLKLCKNSFAPHYAPDIVKKEAAHVIEGVTVADFAKTVIDNYVFKRNKAE